MLLFDVQSWPAFDLCVIAFVCVRACVRVWSFLAGKVFGRAAAKIRNKRQLGGIAVSFCKSNINGKPLL